MTLKSKLPVSSRFSRDESHLSRPDSRLERRDSRLLIRESHIAGITEAEILEYYRVSRENKTTEFLAHLSCDAFLRAILKTRANVFAL